MTPTIWHLIDSRSVGGAERHVAVVVEGLRKLGLDAEAVLYADYGEGPWLRQLASEDIPYRVLNGSFGHLTSTLRSSRPDILHTHGYKAGIVGRAAGLISGIPVVSTFHTGERGRGRLGVYDWLDEWTSFNAERIAVSKRIQNRLPYSSHFIPSSIAPPPSPNTAPLAKTAAFVGRLSEEKCPDIFCALAKAAPRSISWHVYGDGPLRPKLEDSFGDIVTFHGIATDMASVWDKIGLLVMPSRYEGTPIAALEALAEGIPILGTRVGGLIDLVCNPNLGWLFEPGDIRQALAALQEWNEETIDEQIRRRALCWQHAVNHFSEKRSLDALLAVYENLVPYLRSSDQRACVG